MQMVLLIMLPSKLTLPLLTIENVSLKPIELLILGQKQVFVLTGQL